MRFWICEFCEKWDFWIAILNIWNADFFPQCGNQSLTPTCTDNRFFRWPQNLTKLGLLVVKDFFKRMSSRFSQVLESAAVFLLTTWPLRMTRDNCAESCVIKMGCLEFWHLLIWGVTDRNPSLQDPTHIRPKAYFSNTCKLLFFRPKTCQNNFIHTGSNHQFLLLCTQG